jgi:hypothetical protein
VLFLLKTFVWRSRSCVVSAQAIGMGKISTVSSVRALDIGTLGAGGAQPFTFSWGSGFGGVQTRVQEASTTLASADAVRVAKTQYIVIEVKRELPKLPKFCGALICRCGEWHWPGAPLPTNHLNPWAPSFVPSAAPGSPGGVAPAGSDWVLAKHTVAPRALAPLVRASGLSGTAEGSRYAALCGEMDDTLEVAAVHSSGSQGGGVLPLFAKIPASTLAAGPARGRRSGLPAGPHSSNTLPTSAFGSGSRWTSSVIEPDFVSGAAGCFTSAGGLSGSNTLPASAYGSGPRGTSSVIEPDFVRGTVGCFISLVDGAQAAACSTTSQAAWKNIKSSLQCGIASDGLGDSSELDVGRDALLDVGANANLGKALAICCSENDALSVHGRNVGALWADD